MWSHFHFEEINKKKNGNEFKKCVQRKPFSMINTRSVSFTDLVSVWVSFTYICRSHWSMGILRPTKKYLKCSTDQSLTIEPQDSFSWGHINYNALNFAHFYFTMSISVGPFLMWKGHQAGIETEIHHWMEPDRADWPYGQTGHCLVRPIDLAFIYFLTYLLFVSLIRTCKFHRTA